MNQINQKKSFPAAVLVSAVLAVVIGVGIFLALRSEFTADIGHFVYTSPLFCLFAAGCGISVVFSIGSAIYAKKKGLDFPAPLCTCRCAGILPVCAAIAALVLLVMNIRDLLEPDGYTKLALAGTVLMVGIAAFFALCAVPSLRGTKVQGGMGILACLSVNCFLFESYFDFTLPLNSPVRNLLIVMESVYLIYFLTQTGCIFGKKSPAVCHFVKNLTVGLMGGISLGFVLAAVFVSENVPDGVSILRCVVCLLSALAALFIPYEAKAAECGEVCEDCGCSEETEERESAEESEEPEQNDSAEAADEQ